MTDAHQPVAEREHRRAEFFAQAAKIGELPTTILATCESETNPQQSYVLGTPHPDPCSKCGGVLVLSKTTNKKRTKLVYLCANWPRNRCNGCEGAHRDGRPIGRAADDSTHVARFCVHSAFDQLWKNGLMTRDEAYQWLAACG